MSDVNNFFNQENNQQENPVIKEQEVFRIALNTLSTDEITQIFDGFHAEKRQIVITIGFPAAGKSLFLSSLMYYAEKNSDKKWNAKALSSYPFEQGDLARDTMIKFFDNKRAYPVTPPGTLDLIGIDMVPHNRKLKPLKLVFVDLAGDDLRKFRVPLRNELNPQVTAVLKACRLKSDVNNSNPIRPIFCLITPFESPRGHDEENALFDNFLNYIAGHKVNNKKEFEPLYEKSKYIILVSQWDNNTDFVVKDAESYIRKYRAALHTVINGRNSNQYVLGEFSVGDLEDVKDRDNQPMVLIRRIANDYPHKFWCQLYELATGKSLQPRGFLAKLFGF
ncbi:hypothetical protein AGMMS50239_35500 [Bacteroidia bacterium]|nr:hypothetical protein AGMMS50239_35500 [Bacteroidia bacterium]